MREFRQLSIDTIHESAANPRRVFPSKVSRNSLRASAVAVSSNRFLSGHMTTASL